MSHHPNKTVIKKPSWLKVKAPTGDNLHDLKDILRKRKLVTVCEEARCPHMGECWNGGTATFMVLGDTCTRGCRFCAVKTSRVGQAVDIFEPKKIADAVAEMQLEYVVLTAVDRDDVDDQGASHFANTIAAIRRAHPKVLIETLIGDYRGDLEPLEILIKAKPEVLAHNVETARRLSSKVRDPRAKYDQSLMQLERVKQIDPEIYSKSAIMVGLGETFDEVVETMRDLRAVQCDVLTIGQYLQPTTKHLRVENFVHPQTFKEFEKIGKE